MAALGLVLLVAMAAIALAGVFANTGQGHQLGHAVNILGYHLHGSTGKLLLVGVVLGAVGMLGLNLMLAGLDAASSGKSILVTSAGPFAARLRLWWRTATGSPISLKKNTLPGSTPNSETARREARSRPGWPTVTPSPRQQLPAPRARRPVAWRTPEPPTAPMTSHPYVAHWSDLRHVVWGRNARISGLPSNRAGLSRWSLAPAP